MYVSLCVCVRVRAYGCTPALVSPQTGSDKLETTAPPAVTVTIMSSYRHRSSGSHRVCPLQAGQATRVAKEKKVARLKEGVGGWMRTGGGQCLSVSQSLSPSVPPSFRPSVLPSFIPSFLPSFLPPIFKPPRLGRNWSSVPETGDGERKKALTTGQGREDKLVSIKARPKKRESRRVNSKSSGWLTSWAGSVFNIHIYVRTPSRGLAVTRLEFILFWPRITK